MVQRPARTREVVIDGPVGGLEGIVEEPGHPGGGAVCVACHPHPLYHGTMNNKVVHTLARTAVSLGAPAVRFNFRGVGASEGAWDEGRGEVEDALAVVSWARSAWPGADLWLGGFSFGAFVALSAEAHCRPSRLITIAPPIHRFPTDTIPEPACPWLVVQGQDDELVDAAAVSDWVAGHDPMPAFRLIEGVDHFFHGALTRLRAELTAFLAPGAEDSEPARGRCSA